MRRRASTLCHALPTEAASNPFPCSANPLCAVPLPGLRNSRPMGLNSGSYPGPGSPDGTWTPPWTSSALAPDGCPVPPPTAHFGPGSVQARSGQRSRASDARSARFLGIIHSGPGGPGSLQVLVKSSEKSKEVRITLPSRRGSKRLPGLPGLPGLATESNRELTWPLARPFNQILDGIAPTHLDGPRTHTRTMAPYTPLRVSRSRFLGQARPGSVQDGPGTGPG